MGSALTVERVLYSSQSVKGMSNKQFQMFLNSRFSSFYFDILGCLFSPLNSKMKLEDCINPLIEKLRKSLVGWKSKILSFAGRLQLIESTLSSFHLYWASSFLLPKWCLALLERLCCDFFWGCFDSTKKMKTIAWDTICSPLQSGGLGLRSIHASAAAMQLKQAWSLAAQKDSIWLAWLNQSTWKAGLSRTSKFWQIALGRGSGILNGKSIALRHAHHLIGNGYQTFFWIDPWLPCGRWWRSLVKGLYMIWVLVETLELVLSSEMVLGTFLVPLLIFLWSSSTCWFRGWSNLEGYRLRWV